MIETNEFIVEFISKNWIALGLLGAISISIAKSLKWKWLENLINTISTSLNSLRGKRGK
jgi:hypothetical protein